MFGRWDADRDRFGILRDNVRHNEAVVGHHYAGTRRANTAPVAMSQAIYAAGLMQAAPVGRDMMAPHIGASSRSGLAEFLSHIRCLRLLDMSWSIDNRRASGRHEKWLAAGSKAHRSSHRAALGIGC